MRRDTLAWLGARALTRRLGLPRATNLPRTMMRPLVKLTSSRICAVRSQPAATREGVMNLVQMSRSLRVELLIAQIVATPSA